MADFAADAMLELTKLADYPPAAKPGPMEKEAAQNSGLNRTSVLSDCLVTFHVLNCPGGVQVLKSETILNHS